MVYQMTLSQFIGQNQLQPGDAVALACPDIGFPTHYALLLDNINNNPRFIANITEGVQIIAGDNLREFIKKYHVTAIERFRGNIIDRNRAIRKALSRLGHKSYNIVFNNCEHFKNWVLYGESTSKQVKVVGTSLIVGGTGLLLLGKFFENKSMQRVGWMLLIILVIAIVFAAYLKKKNEPQQK